MEKMVGAEIKSFSNLLGRVLDNCLPSADYPQITGPNAFTLKYLHDHKEADIFQKDLEKVLEIRKSTCSAVLSTMEEKGFIVRSAVKDGRYKKITITELGEKALSGAEENILALEKKIRIGLSPEEIDAFFSTMEKMRNNLTE